ncbi:larval cuticle protein 2-like [Penaeus chinensis]|uniref:larval cuticle protein 2-like n=1 Tax=Penaeus chinensis TaxID=139456 RepID=UPI001FB71D7D|nr:larval cuticle protein 2-like [Penaeus chinensis]
MKFNILVLVAVLATVTMATARPDSVLDFEGDAHQHQQEGDAGNKVEGSYSWTSPEGEEFYVKYVADEDGYRVVESNAVPVSHDGVRADGNQGAFGEGEGEGGEGGRE